MSRPWDDAESQVLVETRVFAVRRVRRVSPKDARQHDFFVIEPPDWVNVVALTDAGDVVFVEQWRHGTRSVTIEVPGGMVDPDESAEVAARRELLEETGYEAATLEAIGCVEPNPAILSNRCTTFLARGVRKVREPSFDTTEDCVLRLVPAGDVAGMVRDGAIDHAIVVAALTYAFLRGDLPIG